MAYRRSFDQAQAQGPLYHWAASEARCFCRNWGAATAGERCGGDHAERRPELGRCTPLNLAGFRSGWLAHSPVQHVQATFVPFGVEQRCRASGRGCRQLSRPSRLKRSSRLMMCIIVRGCQVTRQLLRFPAREALRLDVLHTLAASASKAEVDRKICQKEPREFRPWHM